VRAGWLSAATLAAVAIAPAVVGRPHLPAAPRSEPGTAQIREADIGFFQQRIERDPSGALDLVRLGALYLSRFRQSGDEADHVAAERAARRSLQNRDVRNAAALELLVAALLGQHRFNDARKTAERLVLVDPENAVAQASLGEVLLELGEYPAADRVFRKLSAQRYRLELAPRYARWLELRGRVGEARRLLEWAHAEIEADDPAATEQLAWYELRLGELALRFGAHREARERLEAGLARLPDHWRLLAARARLALAMGEYATAIALGDSSLGQHLDPATLAVVGDAWMAQRDSGRAAEYYRALEAATQAPAGRGGGFHRGWYLALLDHDRRVPEVLEAVTRELRERHDVYGYDLLAWALYKSGRVAEARLAMARALEWGTEDPLLEAHARAIEAVR
jgi:tetratricopeptide (TPR) repeat protein